MPWALRITSAVLLACGFLQAMTFQTFDHMAAQDRQDYLDFLVDSAQKVLTRQGRTDDAEKVRRLFNEIHAGSKLPLGEAEFELNLDNARVRSAEKAIKDPSAPPVQVEVALVSTLRKNGIEMSMDFVKGLVQLANSFKPRHSQGEQK